MPIIIIIIKGKPAFTSDLPVQFECVLLKILFYRYLTKGAYGATVVFFYENGIKVYLTEMQTLYSCRIIAFAHNGQVASYAL